MKPALRRIARDERTLQFGLHPTRAILITDLTPPIRGWLDSLDGTRDLRQVMEHATAAGLDESGARSLIDRLTTQGVLDDAATPPTPLQGLSLQERDRLRPDLDALDLASTVPGDALAIVARRRASLVRVYGAGRVGAQIITLLAASGVGNICVVDPAPTRPEDLTPGGLTWSHVGLPRQAAAVSLALRNTTPPPRDPGQSANPAPARPRPSGARTIGPPAPTAVSPSTRARTISSPTPSEALPTRPGPTEVSPSEAGRMETAPPQAGSVRAAPSKTGPIGAPPSKTGSVGRGKEVAVRRRGRKAIQEAAPQNHASVNAWTSGTHLSDGSQRPDLVILAPVGPLDGVLVNELMAMGIPHLLVSAFEGHGSIGPLVLPGETACLHCLDLTRRDRDPAWPVVTARLGGYPVGEIACDTTLAALVAAAAAGHALAHLDGKDHVVTNGTMDICPDWRWRRRSWAVHPQCRCMRNHPYALTMVTSVGDD